MTVMLSISAFMLIALVTIMLAWAWLDPVECGKWLGRIARAFREERGREP